MADTIVTNTPASNDSNAVGGVLAVIVLLAIIVAGVVLYQRGFFSASNTPSTTNVNVTLPTPAPTSGPGTP